MLPWLKKHSKTLNFFGGVLILIITVVLYFWTTTKGVVVSSGGKSAQERRMDRSVNSHSNMIARKSKKSSDMSMFTKKLQKSKKAENFLLFLMVMGFGMVAYSLYSQYREQQRV